MDELICHIAFLVFKFGVRLICVDYDIFAIYQPCDVVPCHTQRRGDISMSPCMVRKGCRFSL